MSQVEVSLAHVAAGCNRVKGALHWGEQGLVAFGAHNAVMIYHPEEARILGTLLGHTDRVNCVRWLPPAALPLAQPAALASGASDGSVRIWQWTPGTPGQPWRVAAVLSAHAAPVTSLAVLPLPAGGLLLVSTAGDGEAAVWECTSPCSSSTSGTNAEGAAAAEPLGQDGWRLRQRIPLGHRLPGCAALAALPADPGWLLLALGGVDSTVRLLLCPPGEGAQFELVCQLAGHQDWVKGLAFAQMDDGKLLLASASQDKNVRVWAVQLQQSGHQSANDSDANPGGAVEAATGAALLTRYAPKPLVRTDVHEYSATLEALLIGHEDWVHAVAWHPRVPCSGGGEGGGGGGRGGTSQPACLLSASMDRTMMIWRPDPATGLWMGEESVGDAGANHLGYYTGVWSPDGSGIAAHGFTGALHIWLRQRGDPPAAGGAASGDAGGLNDEGAGWLPQHALGGHFGPVVDACWAADGACLLTVSTDQTARITTQLADGHWCEVARTQVHGHDFATVAALPAAARGGDVGGDAGSSAQPPRFLYASGSEEKVIRVFEAPRAFRDTLAMARGQPVAPSPGGKAGGGAVAALGALLPALGLSNKAVFDEEEEGSGAAGSTGASGGVAPTGAAAYTEGPDMAPCAAPSAVAGPPLEEHLAQNTLWPEVHKLYGHGNELYCLAADPLGRYLASACRAQSADVAAVWLWDTDRWTGEPLQCAHTLTVTQLAFSPDGRFLASASRDRTVAIFERQPNQQGEAAGMPGAVRGPGFSLLGRLKAHSRIVWALHWSPDSVLLATGARDGTAKVWSLAAAAASPSGCADASALPTAPAAVIDCGDSVRSVQFAPEQCSGAYHLAAGLEGGALQLLRLAGADADGQAGQGQQLQHEVVWHAQPHERHAAAVRRLCWRREREAEGCAAPARLQLASCSDDHLLRIFSVTL
ncbi:hypothetical protein ABPG77_006604 [Micractinium sp. CCAP 211/92]